MLLRIIFTVFLFLSIFVEATLLPFPFFVLTAILFALFLEEFLSFFIILLLSLFLDRMVLHTLGTTAVFLFVYFFAVVLLEKLFRVRINVWIAMGVSAIGVEVYRQYVGYPFLWSMEIGMGILFIFLAAWYRRMLRKGELHAT